MALLTNGNYDRVIELGRRLLTEEAKLSMSLSTSTSPVKSENFEAEVQSSVKIHEMWFRDRPKSWIKESGLGPLHRDSTDMVTLAIELSIHIDLQKLIADVLGIPLEVDLRQLKEEDFGYALRNIDFTTFVEIHDFFDVQTLEVRKDPEVPEYARVPCIVIDFTPNRLRNSPNVDVAINEKDLKKAEMVKLVRDKAALLAGITFQDAAKAAEDAFRGLVNSLQQEIASAIKKQLAELSTWRLHDKGRADENQAEKNRERNLGKALIYADTKLDPRIKSLAVKTLDTSLVIGIDYLSGSGSGDMRDFIASTLRGPDEEFGVTVNNRWLLRNIIRPILRRQFKLSINDFAPAEYCALRGAVSNVPLGDGKTGTLKNLIAFVDGRSQIRIILAFSHDVFPGVTLHADLDLHLRFDVSREVSGAHQVLRIAPRLLNPETAVVSKRVDVAWYIYLAGFVINWILGPLLVLLVDAIYAEWRAGEELNKTVREMSLDSQVEPIPLIHSLTRPQSTLNEPGAPAMPTPLGVPFFLFFGAAAHDLHIGTGSANLPDPLMVTFQIPDSADLGARLDGIGGPLAGTTEWVLPIDDAIALVDSGHQLLVPIPVDQPVRVIKAIKNGVPYIRTETDDLGINNLGNLPKRI